MLSSTTDGQRASTSQSNGSEPTNGLSTAVTTPVGTVSVVDVEAHQGLTDTAGGDGNAAMPVSVSSRSCNETSPTNLMAWITHPRQTFNTWWYGESVQPVSIPEINVHSDVEGLATTESTPDPGQADENQAELPEVNADTTEQVNQGNDIQASESEKLSSEYNTPLEPEAPKLKMTCCQKIKAFFIMCCTAIAVLWEKFKSCLYRCFCCGADNSEDALYDVVDGDVVLSDSNKSDEATEEVEGAEEFSDALVETNLQKTRFLCLVDSYRLAFSDFAKKGFFWGVAWNQDKVNGIINKAKPVLYKYTSEEAKTIVLSGNANGRDLREIENDVYSHILKTAMVELNFTDERIKESYTIFNQERDDSLGENFYMEDKDNGDCILFVYYRWAPGGARETHLPFSKAAYRKATRDLAAERNVDVTDL